VVVAATIHAAGLFSSSAITIDAWQIRRRVDSGHPVRQRAHS
jgi:hypothetical protein